MLNLDLKQKFLETVVRNLKRCDSEILTPVKGVVYLELDENFDDSGGKKAFTIGIFYEHVTAALYGGELEQRIVLDDGTSIRLDVYDKKRHIAYEAKAIRSGRHSSLVDNQMENYEKLQLYDKNLMLFFPFYRHGVRIKQAKWKGTPQELINMLRSGEQYSIVLPLSLVLALHHNNENSGFTYRHDAESPYESNTQIKTSAFSVIAKYPRQVISELGLEPRNYKIKRYFLPQGIRVVGIRNGRKISEGKLHPFPVVRISETPSYHRRFVDELETRYTEDIPF